MLILLRLTYITYATFQISAKSKFLENLLVGFRGSGISGVGAGNSGFPGYSGPGSETPGY
jgi:hypothetical protein